MAGRATTGLTKGAVEAAVPGDWLWDGGTRGVNGFGLRVAPGGAKSFIYRYRISGKQTVLTLGRYPALTVEQARKLAAARAHDVAAGKDPQKARKALRSAPTVASLAEHYLGDYARSQPLRPSTVRDARDVLRHVLPTLSKLRVAEVDTDDIRRACTRVRELGQETAAGEAKERRRAANAMARAVEEARAAVELAEWENRGAGTLRRMHQARQAEAARADMLATKAEAWASCGRAGVHQSNRLRAVLGVMFNEAVDRGWRGDNPCRPVKKLREDERWRHLSPAEVARLLAACDQYERDRDMSPQARAAADAVRLLLFTGARLREVLRAEWGQFDLEAGLWEKPSAHTKTKRQHRLEVGGPALDLLRDMHSRLAHARFLFPEGRRRGQASQGAPAGPFVAAKPRADLNGPWRTIAGMAGLEGVRLHDLRRTLASFILSDNGSLATVGKALGHTQVRTTARYAHLHDHVQRQAMTSAGERMLASLGIAGVGTVVPLKGRA